MQNLPVIFAVFAAAAAIIGILLWRLKPQAAPNTDALDKRISEEVKKAEALQSKIDANETTLRNAVASASAATATAEAAKSQAIIADTNLNQVKKELAFLQVKYSEAEPLIATATAQKKAADEARTEMGQRHADLTALYASLQGNANAFMERATKAEKDAASAKAEAEATHKRAEVSEAKLDDATVYLANLNVEVTDTKSLLVESVTKQEAVENAKNNLEQRLAATTNKYDSLVTEHKLGVERAATAETDATNTHIRNGEILGAYELIAIELDRVKRELVEAATKQQSSEDSVRQFDNISRSILKDVLGDAKREIAELAATLKKGSDVELEKHAEKVAQTLEPLQAKLLAYDEAVESLKKGTQENYGSLKEQLSELQKTERLLHDEARALTSALSSNSKVKGNYGEMILKQLVEFVGMQDKCHFETQASRETEEGRKIPDLVVSLPGGQKVLVDSKAIMGACIEAQTCPDDKQRTILLKKHCDNVRSRVVDLSSKNYFADHQDAVEAVVLFLPAENLYSTAMENDPYLTEYAMGKNIILCGPNSLMLLLKVSNQLWRRAAVEKEVKDIRDCGEKIYKSACDFVEKFAGIGRKIQSLETEYNSAVATFEGRLLPAGKRMCTFESVSGNKEIADLEPIKDNVREFKEATKQVAARTPKLLDLIIGDETAELAFSAGDK